MSEEIKQQDPKQQKRKQLTISPRQQDMLDELMEYTGATTETEVFRIALVEYYKKNLQSYTAVQAKRAHKISLTREDRARDRRMTAEERKKDTEEYGKGICNELGGKAFKEGTNMICKWTTYDMVNPKHVIMGELELPFEQLNESHIAEQYQNGTKEEIEKAIADGAEVE